MLTKRQLEWLAKTRQHRLTLKPKASLEINSDTKVQFTSKTQQFSTCLDLITFPRNTQSKH